MSAFTQTVGACPLDCPDACSWLMTVERDGEDGRSSRAVKIRGNPKHPITAGGLCKKVNPWLSYASDPSRLLRPLRRVGAKGEGRFEPVSWDEALAEIADRFAAIIDRHGGEAIWPFVGTGHQGWIQGSNAGARIWTRMGASRNHGSICAIGGLEGMRYTIGSGGWTDAEAFARAGLVLVWGSNTKVTNRHLWPFIEQARQAGAKLVVVDPVQTRTADAADTYLSLRPGTDGALALGLCSAIAAAGGADDRFLSERCIGGDEFVSSLAPWTPRRTEAVTGVPAGELTKLAEMIVAAPPLAVRVGHGIQRHANGGQAMRVVSCIPAMTGAYDQPGGGVLYSLTGTRNGFNLDRSRRPDLHPLGPDHNRRTLATTNLAANLLNAQGQLDPPVEALVIWGANPMVSNPDTNQVREGLAREDLFTVAIEIFPTETTAYADLVLPSAMQHEQLDLTGSYHHRYLQWNEPAVAPPGDCLAHTEIFRRLSAAMGYHESELFASDTELVADLLDSDDLRAARVTPAALRTAGFLPLPDLPAPADRAFLTPSRRFEFRSARAEQDGHGALPNYRPAAEASNLAPGHLALIAAASDLMINSTFGGTARTLANPGPAPLHLHPVDAAYRGLADGDEVIVANGRGEMRATVIVTDRTSVGVAATAKGWWGSGINNTVIERDADMGSGARFHDNAVTVTAVR